MQAHYHDILNVAWATRVKARPNASVEESRSDWFSGPSKQISRGPWGEGTGVLCTSSSVYSYELDMVLLGNRTMSLHGWPRI